MLTFLAIHVGSILVLLVWMVLESLVRRGNIDIFGPLSEAARDHNVPIKAMWMTILFLPEFVIVVAVLRVLMNILNAIFE